MKTKVNILQHSKLDANSVLNKNFGDAGFSRDGQQPEAQNEFMRNSPAANVASTVQCVIYHCKEQRVIDEVNVVRADD